MKIRIHIAPLAAAAFVAATLQGSRLPAPAVDPGARVAPAEVTAYRAGPGKDRDEYPPRSDTAVA